MDLAKKQLDKAYSPYKKECLYCMEIASVVTIIGIIVMLIFNLHRISPGLFLLFPIYWIAEALINFRLTLLCLWKKRKMYYLTQKVSIVRVCTESGFSGHWGSIVPQLYPRKLQVERAKLICVDNSGKKLFFRCVMSGKKWQSLSDRIPKGETLERTITYGKLSRIIVLWDDKDELSFLMNHMF